MSPVININDVEIEVGTVNQTIHWIEANGSYLNPTLSVKVNTDEEILEIKKIYPNIKIIKNE